MKIYIAKGFRKDVTSAKLIEKMTQKEHMDANHATADRVIEKLMSEIYKPNLKSLVRKFIGKCGCHLQATIINPRENNHRKQQLDQ